MIRAKLKFIEDASEKTVLVNLECVPSLGEQISYQELFLKGEVRKIYHELIHLGIENRLVHTLVVEIA